jgi:SAM-dependent methyltransferase
VFGEVAEGYDAARPGYADALVTEVLDYAALDGRAAVEVGAGTGKATVPFAARGVPLVCVEPDPRMADVLRRNTAAYPQVRVEIGDFEAWDRRDQRFGLLFAATCWHWLAPDRRWDLVHAALEPGGTVALFWNPQGIVDTDLHLELARIDAEFGVVGPPHAALAADYGDQPGRWVDDDGWPEPECRRDSRFTDPRGIRFDRETWYDTERYVTYLASVSAYRILPQERRTRVLTATADLLDARGGGIAMRSMNDLFLARRD